MLIPAFNQSDATSEIRAWKCDQQTVISIIRPYFRFTTYQRESPVLFLTQNLSNSSSERRREEIFDQKRLESHPGRNEMRKMIVSKLNLFFKL